MRSMSKAERAAMRDKMFDHPSSERARTERAATHDSPADNLMRQQHRERGELGERHRREALDQMAKHQHERARELEGGAPHRGPEREQERQQLVDKHARERSALDARHQADRATIRAAK